MNKLLSVSGLCKSYQTGSSQVEVLKGINLEVAKGTTTALVGASGAGKTTLLHIMGALDRPSSGTVLFNGKNLFKHTDRELADFRSKNIGFVFQFHHLLPEFSAVENTMMPALIARENRRQAEDKAKELLSELGLGHRFEHRPGELSGGEQQRVAIARALVMNPDLLLADEPTGNLDMKTSEAIHQSLLRLQQKNGITMIIVTHNERLAAGMEQVIRLTDGLIKSSVAEVL
ncbi:MAG: ABC transporter ATP-binding protein [Trichlorobacter sp.]|jgi:lipoprotein-releasing system ATP-binding protein|nr:ABC transporter ATP-binding protein [Trichlorobacter sp.]